ncbi:MAG: hypothetical protein ACREQ5_22885, partial [Candidatus Dormibacteria bacterium]
MGEHLRLSGLRIAATRTRAFDTAALPAPNVVVPRRRLAAAGTSARPRFGGSRVEPVRSVAGRSHVSRCRLR